MLSYGRVLVVVDDALLKHVLVQWGSHWSVARDRSSHRLNIMVRIVSDMVASDLRSDSPPLKLKNEES